MNRRCFIGGALAVWATGAVGGCRSKQYAKVMHEGEPGMVGSHQAGGESQHDTQGE